ncbi:tetratricopeptide repeat protein [Megalodesulfovibrio gigas]|uniref:Uncharacterized protein n=1 Tax=Megalodesulfovibrio gigas (strain ATCC 19364 / DSM 1382 / NCIMB 9332 / VKM B-1759) TaxID=1121448 RepID=T2GDJ2_MEGG1|nr:tetratricopeptide repeat protein [Megalodesulfovibrio gigas]AGW14635.1 hypothetical protein DGI_2909 [Megalodesulfovibrio gigas DSM 1382 = ATCC 19364]
MHQPLRLLTIALALLWTVAWSKKDAYPPQEAMQPALRQDPRQEERLQPAFNVEQGGVRYVISPKAEYELYGLVVSSHDTDAWWDFYHQHWGDYLNVKDLCVIWGPNLRPDILQAVSFSNTSFTCEASWRQPVPFSSAHFSNNHLLTDNPAIQHALRRTARGDQIRIVGQLVEYSSGPDFSRGTSLTRTDDGMGACETIFVTELDILAEATPLWRNLYTLGRSGTLLGLILLTVLGVYRLFRPAPLPDPIALHARGVRLAMQGRHKRACALFDEALQLDPTLHQAYADRATCMEVLGQFRRAERDRELAARYAPRE